MTLAVIVSIGILLAYGLVCLIVKYPEKFEPPLNVIFRISFWIWCYLFVFHGYLAHDKALYLLEANLDHLPDHVPKYLDEINADLLLVKYGFYIVIATTIASVLASFLAGRNSTE